MMIKFGTLGTKTERLPLAKPHVPLIKTFKHQILLTSELDVGATTYQVTCNFDHEVT